MEVGTMEKLDATEKSKKKTQALAAKIKKARGNCACYVLITCSKPEESGKMDVEMEFEGDEDLAAFLVACKLLPASPLNA